ncbi:MAG: CHAD domain-containing protein [Clostridiales bacterium]|nr:CHAD domain-containing protein [Clostridiales bacterium]
MKQELQYILSENLNDIINWYESFLKTPDDNEAAHHVRVSARRLRSLLSFLGKTLDKDSVLSMKAGLKAFAAVFAYLRELDVLLQKMVIISSDDEKLQEAVKPLLEILKKERAEESARLCRSLSGADGSKPLMECVKQLSVGGFMDSPVTKERIKDYSEQRLKVWLWRVTRQRENLDYKDRAAVHGLRIKCKKLRYSLDALQELCGKAPGKAALETIEGIKQLQEGLGMICDMQRNSEIIGQLTKLAEKKEQTKLAEQTKLTEQTGKTKQSKQSKQTEQTEQSEKTDAGEDMVNMAALEYARGIYEGYQAAEAERHIAEIKSIRLGELKCKSWA